MVIEQNADQGAGQVQFHAPLGQSFLALDADIGLTALFVNPFNPQFNDPTLEMVLFSGAGDFSASARLISQVFTLDSEYHDWLYLDVSNINFVAGSNYTIGVFNDTPQWGVSNSALDVYPAGNAYVNGTATGNDLTFKVLPRSAAPEPGVSGLIVLGLLCLCLSRRRLSYHHSNCHPVQTLDRISLLQMSGMENDFTIGQFSRKGMRPGSLIPGLQMATSIN